MNAERDVDTVIFDLDGTLTRVPSPWRYVHERLGVWDSRASEFLEQWLSGEIDYEEFSRRDLGLWQGRRLKEILAILDEIETNPYVPALVRRLASEQIPATIISSGFSCVARRIQSWLDWNPLRICANELLEGPRVRIQVSADPDSPLSKRQVLETILNSTGQDPKRALVVSDSPEDLRMMAACGYGILVEEETDLLKVQELLDRTHE